MIQHAVFITGTWRGIGDRPINHGVFQLKGTWREIGDRPINHGVFQLKISNNSKAITGKWLGIPFDDKYGIMTGDWKLDLVPLRS